jgi:hypothetical protein
MFSFVQLAAFRVLAEKTVPAKKTLPARKPANTKSTTAKSRRGVLTLPDEATFKELARLADTISRHAAYLGCGSLVTSGRQGGSGKVRGFVREWRARENEDDNSYIIDINT